MSDFTKIYLPILGTLLLFSGFWYIKSYFGFYDMREVVAGLSVDYIAQMSFAVIYSLLTFESLFSSLLFLLIVALPFLLTWAFPETEIVRVEGKSENKLVVCLGAIVSGVRGFSLPLKLIVVGWVLSIAIWTVSSRVGATHACSLMQTRTNQISDSYNISGGDEWRSLTDRIAISGDVIKDASGNPLLFEIWRNGDWAYFGTRSRSCTGQRFTIKLATSKIPLSVSSITSE